MSLIDSMNAAVGGLSAQSTALANISENVANSQTVGYKSVNTSFVDYVTGSTPLINNPDTVVARPDYTTSTAGTITQVSNPTSLAISGNGFFAVQEPTGDSTFSQQQYYTQTGDFSTNAQGYLVNSTGYALDGWPVTNGVTNTNTLQPIQVSTAPSAPVASSSISLAANLPSSPVTTSTSYSTTEQVYDAQGNAQSVDLTYTPATTGTPATVVANQWNLTVTNPASGYSQTMTLTFGDGTSSGGTAGTLQKITDPAATTDAPSTGDTGTAMALPTTQASGDSATIALNLDFGSGNQAINLNLGSFGSASGLTQYAGSSYQVNSQSVDGSPQSAFSSVAVQTNGNVVISYQNGSTKTIAQVPIATFTNPNGLQQQNGQAYTSTVDSGSPSVSAAGSNGAGTLVVGAEEGSNVDLSAEFTNMIVVQNAYIANTKMISTANTMMQDVLQMVQG